MLVDRSSEAGLSERLGWWNGIAARDLDNDGDIDYVVTNFGLNTTYHPSEEKPRIVVLRRLRRFRQTAFGRSEVRRRHLFSATWVELFQPCDAVCS